MPTAPDGILTAEWDEARALVTLSTNGAEWAVEPETVTITRATPSGGTVLVRDLDRAAAVGGVVLGSDTEMLGFDLDYTYAATGYDSLGDALETSTVTVSTPYADWGLVVRVPGRGELTTRVGLVRVGPRAEGTQGGAWSVLGGPAIGQSAGMGALRATVEVMTETSAAADILANIVRSAPSQTVLIQTGTPAPRLPNGYYQVAGATYDARGEGALRGGYEVEHHTLPMTAVRAPAGRGTGWFGITHDMIATTFTDHQDIADTVASHLELARGEWS